MAETGYSEELKNFVKTLVKVNPKDWPEAWEILQMQVIWTLEEEILPDYFKNKATWGESTKANIPWKLFMTKNPTNLNP